MKKKVLVGLGYKMYPDITGGMEMYNYRWIAALQDEMEISYACGRDLGFSRARHLPLSEWRPQKLLLPLQVLRHLLRHREIKSVVFSYSEASWVIWRLFTLFTRWMHLRTTIVIHFGNPSTGSAKRVLNAFFPSAANVFAVSEDIKRNYDAAFGLHCRIVYPTMPFRRSSRTREQLRQDLGIAPDAFSIAMVGSLKEMKNPDTALACLALFSADELHILRPILLLAGDGPMRERLEQYAAKHGLQERVRFLGCIPQEKVCEVMSISDCFLIASDFEGTSLSLMEAMFNGLPIIASDVPGIRDMVTDQKNALLFPRKDASALKACILRFHQDPELARTTGQRAAQTFAERYSFDHVRQTYLETL